MIDLRPAKPADADLLFAWRNDPETLAGSRSTAAVPREHHDRWMQFNVMGGYPEHIVMIADSDFGSVGVVRFDADKADSMRYGVSITIAPQHRGKHLSIGVLSEACRFMQDFAIDAEVRRDNIASRKLFARCGFEEIGRKDGFLQFRKEPAR